LKIIQNKEETSGRNKETKKLIVKIFNVSLVSFQLSKDIWNKRKDKAEKTTVKN